MREAVRFRWRRFPRRNFCRAACWCALRPPWSRRVLNERPQQFARKSLLQKAQSRPDLVREVIGKVQRDGILSAIQAVRSRLDQPQSPGYSSAGTVIAVGEGVVDLRPGDRVACAGAGFAMHAEVACVPRLLVARIPARASGEEEVPFDEAAFATLGAVALHGIRTAEAKLGDLVAVIGLGTARTTYSATAEGRWVPCPGLGY